MTEYALTYDDVTLVPEFSDIASRKDPSTECSIMGLELKTPILTANMDTITESKMAIAAWNAGGVGVLHRFMDVEKNCEEYANVRIAGAECMVSIGAKDWLPRAEALYSAGARLFVIDIAHGHSSLVRDVITTMRDKYGNDVRIMAGNVATSSAVRSLKEWGADAVKVGVGGGSICTTRVVTGFGIPMFSSVFDCALAARKLGMDVIADGGIRSSGDIVKALVAGASGVMVGRLFAGTDETPGESWESTNEMGFPRKKKQYNGMSSVSTRVRIGSSALAEGIDAVVECQGSVAGKIQDLTAGIKSGMTYGGCRTVHQLRRVKFLQQTPHGTIEGTPHILK